MTRDVRPKPEQADVDRDLAACVVHLGQNVVTEAMNRGRAMTLDEAFTLALQEH